MNRKRIFAPFLALALLVTVYGCASGATPARKSFTTISDAATGVNQAMKLFNQQYQAGQRNEDQRDRVLAAYAVYQKVALDVVGSAKAGTSVNALQLVNDAALPLLALINSFTGATP